MITAVCLSGGGVKGLAYLGVLRWLEEMEWVDGVQQWVGCSIGGVVCFLAAMGYRTAEIQALLEEDEVSSALTRMEVDVTQMLERYGLIDGTAFVDLFGEFLYRKTGFRDMEFQEFVKWCGKNVVLVGSNVTTKKEVYFGVDETPTMSIIKALRITISLPMLMEPVSYKGDLYVDGGIYRHFPWQYGTGPSPSTLGVRIVSESSPSSPTWYGYLWSIIDSVLDKLGDAQMESVPFPERICQLTLPTDTFVRWDTMELLPYREWMHPFLERGYEAIQAWHASLGRIHVLREPR